MRKFFLLETYKWKRDPYVGKNLHMEKRELRMIVADNLERLMADREYSANRLATDAGLSYTSVYDILKGRSKNPRIDTLSKISLILGVPLTSLFNEATDDQIRESLLFAYEQMDEDSRERLLRTAEAWLPAGNEMSGKEAH